MRDKANQPKLTPDERNMLLQLVRSPGWYILMREYVLPAIDQAVHVCTHPGQVPEDVRAAARGKRDFAMQLLDKLYAIAEVPHPMQRPYDHVLENLLAYNYMPDEDRAKLVVLHWIQNGRTLCDLRTSDLQWASSPGDVTCEDCRQLLAGRPHSHPKRAGFPV